MFRPVSIALSACALSVLAVAALADPKPRGAKVPSAQTVMSTYVGRTDLWEDNCNGGIYYGPGNAARAWCADAGESLGAGTWTVDDQGRLCTDLTWYWPDGGRAGRSPGGQSCIFHVVDRYGKLWRNWPSDNEWWPVKGKYSTLVPGYRFQVEILKTKSRLGI